MSGQQQTKVYTVDLGNGHVMDVEGPPDASPEELQAFVKQSHQSMSAPLSPTTVSPPTAAAGPTTNGTAASENDLPLTPPPQETRPTSVIQDGPMALVDHLTGVDGPDKPPQRMPDGTIRLIHADGSWDEFGSRDSYEKAMFERRYAKGDPNSDAYVKAFTDHFGDPPELVVDVVGGHSEDPFKEQRKGALGSVDALVRKGANAVTLGGADHLAAALDMLTGGSYTENLRKEHGIGQSDDSNHPVASIGGTIAGSLLLPVSSEASLCKLTLQGGAMGAVDGALSANTPGQALAGAATQGLLGAGLSPLAKIGGEKLGDIAASRAASRNAQIAPQTEMLQAADRIGLGDKLLPADTGGPLTRAFSAFTAQTPFGAPAIIRRADKLNDAAGDVVAREAASLGEHAADVEGLGTAATEGALKYVATAKKYGGRLYDIAASKAGDHPIDLKQTRDVVDAQIARLEAVPGGGAGLDELKTLRGQLDKPYSVQGVRDMRTEAFIDPKFRNTPVEGRMKAISNAAASDVETGLRAAGKGDAADLYRAADDNWRGMLGNIRRNIEPIIGPLNNLKNAEGVASALNSATKNNGARLGAFVNSLPKDQQQVVTATLITPLGRDPAGTFSLTRFATDWASSARSRSALRSPVRRAPHWTIWRRSGLRRSARPNIRTFRTRVEL